MKHAFRARLINNQIKQDNEEEKDLYRHKEDLELRDDYMGYGKDVKQRKNDWIEKIPSRNQILSNREKDYNKQALL